ncbi:MAG: YraN family protein [Oscillospiraceae bacterium]|nr:YraN family protein [Oscillospiraceae bacterium]
MLHMNKRQYYGKMGEDLTAYYLVRSGYTIIRRNYRIRGGEIDIIAENDDTIAFVEVRTRSANAWESGAATVGSRKKQLIIRTAVDYLMRFPSDKQPRYDISEVTVHNGRPIHFNYYDAAFDCSQR